LIIIRFLVHTMILLASSQISWLHKPEYYIGTAQDSKHTW